MNYKKLYMDFYGYYEGDFIPCAICQAPAVDIHHIDAKGMGGDDSRNRIENLIALCRKHHTDLGDRIQYKSMLYKLVFYQLMRKDFDTFEWIVNQIERYQRINP
ncbi:MAG: HNH endonuclease [Acidiferrobacterales bacterium]